MKNLVKSVCPPVLWKLARTLKTKISPEADPWSDERLFDGDGSLFRELVNEATHYGEYGVGSSTIWVVQNTDVQISSVDTSQEWIENVYAQTGRDRVQITWADLGPLGGWGRPISYDHRSDFQTYWTALWQADSKPDLVLIDGRFRVRCLLHCLSVAQPGTKILFDDYTDRPYYHIVEKLLAPARYCGRQALFIVPETVDEALVEELKIKFEYVME